MQKNRHTILYVDDSLVNLTTFQQSFIEEYDVVLSQSGMEGLQVLKEKPISVIITDYRMPEMDGVEFLQQALRITPIVPRILLTAYGSFDNIQEAVNKAKIFQYVQKPWNKSEIKHIIDRAIEVYEIHDENIKLNKKLQRNNNRLRKELKEKGVLLKHLKESESFYKKSQEYLRKIMNTANSVIFVLSEDFKILEWNDEGQKYFNSKVGSFFLQEFLSLDVIGDEKTLYQVSFQRSIKNRNSLSFEGKLYYKKEWVSFYWNTSPLFDEGKVIGIILIGQNIEELKKAQQQKRESLRLYRLLTENAYDVIWTTDKDLTFTYVSPSVERLYGYTQDELLGSKFEALVEPEMYGEIKKRIEKFLEGIDIGEVDKEAVNFEVRQPCKNGSLIWTHTLVNKVFDEDNNFLFFSGVTRNISQKKQAEIKIRQSEQKFSKLFHASPDCMLLVNLANHEVVDANEIFLRMKGWGKEKVVGNKLESTGFWPNPSDKEQVEKNLESNGVVRNYEMRCDIKGRERIGLLAVEKMLIEDEHHALFIIKDITERKKWEEALSKSEEKFRTIFENSVVGYYRISVDGKLWIANAALIKMLGFASVEEYKSHSLSKEHFSNEVRSEFYKKIFREGTLIDEENTWLKKDGTTMYVSESAKAIRNLDNEIVYIDGTIVNITERINSKIALKESEQRLREAQKLAHIGHWVYDHASDLTVWSEEVYRIFGIPLLKEPLAFDKAFDFIEQEKRDEIHMALKDAVVKRKEFLRSCKIFRKNGTHRIITLRARSNYGKNGEPTKTLGTIQDITELKQAEEKIKKLNESLEQKVFERTLSYRQSERKFRQLLKYIPDGIILVNSDLKIILVNDQAQRIFGYKRAEMTKQDIRITIPERYSETISQYFQETFNGSEEMQSKGGIDFYGKKKDGTEFPIDIRLGAVQIDSQSHIICIIRDITIRKKNENELRKLTQSLEQHPGSVVITNKEQLIEYVNPNFEKTTGYSREEVLGKHPRILIAEGLPDSFYEELLKTIAQKKVWHGDFLHKKKNGELFWERSSIAPILNSDGEVTNYVSVRYEITEAKKNEEHLKFATYTIEHAGDAIYWIDAKSGDIVYVNNAGYESLGYTIEEMLMLKYYQLDQKTTKIQWEKIRLKLLDQKYIQFDARLQKKNKGNLYVQITASLVKYEGTNYVIAFAQDVSKKRETERQLKRAKAFAESASRTKSEFIANMSHEIRTPLNAVLGITELLLQQIKDELQINYLKTIKSSGRNLLRIINDILDISKIEAGKMTVKSKMVNLKELIEELEQMFGVKANEKGINLKADVDPELPDFVNLDDLRLRQVLVNLISNAIKFTSDGYVIIKLDVLNAPVGKDDPVDIAIQVEDTGIGIEEEFKTKAFEEFSQQDRQDSKKFEGSGLGLAISKKLVELMGGEISVQSKKNEGTKFTIELKSIKHSTHPPDLITESNGPVHKQYFLQSKVLIVDDAEESRKYLQGVFKGMKVDTYFAENGKKAYDLALKVRPDLVITDIMMPVMNGLELSKKIKETPALKHTKIIANSAAVLTIPEKQIQSASIDAFLIKPVALDKLYRYLKEYLPYDKFYGKDETEQETGNEKNNFPPEIIEELKQEAYPLWSKLQGNQKMNDVEKFSEIIKEIGVIHKNKALIDYSKKLNEALKAFDIDAILRLLKQFKMFIDS